MASPSIRQWWRQRRQIAPLELDAFPSAAEKPFEAEKTLHLVFTGELKSSLLWMECLSQPPVSVSRADEDTGPSQNTGPYRLAHGVPASKTAWLQGRGPSRHFQEYARQANCLLTWSEKLLTIYSFQNHITCCPVNTTATSRWKGA